MTPQRTTITQVAERAGVSLATASRAINGAGASPAAVAKVRRAAQELGYVPDATARSLKLGHSLQLAFSVDDVGNPVYVEMMRAIEEVVSASGYRLLVSSTGSDPGDVVDLVRSLARGYADGLIVSPLRVTAELVTELERTAVPVVVIGRMPEDSRLDTVLADSATGVGLAYDHLAAQGRRSIGFLNGPTDTTPGAARLAGFAAASRRAGRPGAEELGAVAEDFTVAAGRDAATGMLARYRDAAGRCTLDALVAANDLLAFGAVHAARAAGLRVPEDLAVVGMDDTEFASVFQPALSSVSLGSAERGRRAAELLLRRLDDPHAEPARVTVPPRLVVRTSSAASDPTTEAGR